MIEVKNLTKEFKTYERDPGFIGAIKSLFIKKTKVTKAVDDVNFKINKGEIVGYIGANGAGKSTTIKMLTGILVPTSGKCRVNGLVPHEDRKKNAKDIGVVFGQRTQLWWDLPLTETFTILKEIYDVSDEDYQERMEFLNEVLELDDFISNPVRTLSLGQRMRADLAAALLHKPKILYLDEPTVGLDIVVKERLRKAIKEINQQYQTTVILTTHDIDDIEKLCDRIIIIDEGKKIYDGSLDEIIASYGYMQRMEVDLKYMKEVENIKSEDFNLSNGDIEISKKRNIVSIKFNNNKITTPEIASYVMSQAEVADININEANIEEIVKKIYRNEVNL